LIAPGSSRRRVLTAVFASCLGVGLIFGFQPPLVALVLSRGGYSNSAIGAVTSASLIAVMLMGPAYPRLIARVGLKRAVVMGVGAGALILAAMPLWPNVPAWMLLRSLTGCALGLSWIASEVWLNSAAGPDFRGTVMGIYGTVFSIGTMAGPALLELTGTRGWRPFEFGSIALLLTLLPLLATPQTGGPAEPFSATGGLARLIMRAPIIMLAAWVAGLVESAELALLPLFGLHAGFGERQALWLVTAFMAGNVVLQAPIGMLADRYGRAALLCVCAAASVLGPLLLAPWIGRPALLWPLLFIWGGTLYAFYSQGIALLGGAFGDSELPAANTVFVMVYCLGGVIGPGVGGMAMDVWPRFGLQAVLSAAAGLLLIGMLVGAVRSRCADVQFGRQ
jgi:MFS family permease